MNTTTKSTHAASMRAGILLLVAASCLLTRAQAQTLLTTHGNQLAVIDQPVPGPSGAYFQVFDLPVIADNGTVLFLSRMYGGDVSGNGNSRALFRGTTAADLSIMLRSSDPAFTESVRRAVTRSVFYAAENKGKKVKQLVQQSFKFASTK